jgi:hypothetical protein
VIDQLRATSLRYHARIVSVRRPSPPPAEPFGPTRWPISPNLALCIRHAQEIERDINGRTPEERLAVRRERSRPLVIALETWLRQQRSLLSKSSKTAKATHYSLKRWNSFP